MRPRKNILVVDDNVGCRESLRLILNPLYEVTLAQSGEEALGYLTQKEVDLVILDLIMPGMTGFDFLRAVRSRKRGIEVLVISGTCSSLNVQKATELGGAGFILKPFSVPEVVMSVTRIFDRNRDKLEGNAPPA